MITLKDIANLEMVDDTMLEVYTELDDMLCDCDPLFIVPELKSMHEFLTERYLNAEVKGIDAYDDSVRVLIKV